MKLLRNPAQAFALIVGAVLLAAGVLALAAGSTNLGTVAEGAGRDLLIWQVSGWETIFYLAVGTLALMAASRVGTARVFALAAGYVFVALAVYGFVDGNDIVSVFAVGTADKLTYLAIGLTGLMIGAISQARKRLHEVQAPSRGPSHPTQA
jgi:hypothetical protein